MDQIIKCLSIKNGDIIISQIMEVDTELGQQQNLIEIS